MLELHCVAGFYDVCLWIDLFKEKKTNLNFELEVGFWFLSLPLSQTHILFPHPAGLALAEEQSFYFEKSLFDISSPTVDTAE